MKSVTESVKSLKNLNRRKIVFIICLIFYGFMAIYYGPVLASDSNGYINMISAREPIYPLFLLLLRTLFGKYYLTIVVLTQNLLMAYAVYRLIATLDSNFKLTNLQIVFILLCFAAVAFVCIFFTARAVPYTNVILTEGLAMPLWILFIDFLINGIYKEKISYILAALLMSSIMMDIRKQMAIGFIVTFGAVFVSWIKKKGYFKRLFITLGMMVFSLILAIGITRIYNYALRGEFSQNTRDMNLVLTTSLYVSDREDAELIKEQDVRNLYLKVCDSLEENKCTYAFAPKDLAGLQSHYSDSFDKITIDTTADLFVEDAIERGFPEGIQAEAEADRVSGVIVKSILKDNLGKYFLVYISSLEEGFVNTVAKRHPVLDIYALIMYILYISLMIYNIANKELRNKGVLGLIILIAIAVNVGVTGALIFCQTRYMIYNMSLFYVAMVVMFPFDKMKIKRAEAN